MSSDIKLGTLCGPDARRDAVHVACAPVEAGEDLLPGCRAEIGPDGKAIRPRHKSDYIVDPFLQQVVRKGQWFFLLLPPGTVTSLRHVWAAPGFPPEEPADLSDRAYSERWLREYAVRWNDYEGDPCQAFSTLIRDLQSGHLTRFGSESYSLSDVDDADDLKRHAERYLGITIDWGKFTFSCSC